MLILWICVAIAAAVFGVMIYFDRDLPEIQGCRAGDLRAQHQGRDHLDGDSGVILVAMAIPAAQDTGQDRRYARLRSSP